ncbi:MAG: penicillin-binding protein [Oscillospiraceae bacterium]|jgi:peptidoglycan glycosyltransferase|nr:penicillin-binding protein [Oscillospiraceae bacterium]
MRKIAKRIWVLLALLLGFTAGLGLLGFGFARHGALWATNRANGHIYANGAMARAGNILDRGGLVLAETKGGKRVLYPSAAMRKATLHAVGDPQGFVSTGAHSAFRSTLTGYNGVTGIYELIKNGKGADVTLSIDAQLCKTAWQALNGRKGAVGVSNYETGEVLCMVSSPSFDPLHKPADIEDNPAYDAVYLNRFLHGLFTPGSTFKIITAACAITHLPDIESRTFTCNGGYATGEGLVVCREKHGKVDFQQALNVSCNTAFAQLAVELGQANLQKTARELGFDRAFNAGKLPLAMGLFASTKPWSALELGWAGVGQHTTLANPCQMLLLMGAIANGGKGVAPKLTANSAAQTLLPPKTALSIDPALAARLRELLRSDVTAVYDPGGRKTPGLELCGKTGTAEVDGERPHAWFVGFARNAPYAIVVVGENAGGGQSVAFEIAAKVLNAAKNNA